MSSKDCVQYINNWIVKNSDKLVYDLSCLNIRNQMIQDKGRSHIGDGTKPSDWKRRGMKRLDDGTTLRAFRNGLTIFDFETVILIHEKDGVITKLEYGLDDEFDIKYNMEVGY